MADPNFSTKNILSSANYKMPRSIGANSVDHNFRIEYNQVYNLSMQKALSHSTTLDLEYVGSRTVNADSSTVVNMPALPPPGTTTSVNSRRPYPQLSAFDAPLEWMVKVQLALCEGYTPLHQGAVFFDDIYVVKVPR